MKSYFVLSVFIATLFVTGCDYVQTTEVTNHAKKELTIITTDPGKTVRIYNLAPGESLKFYLSAKLKIAAGNQTWEYERKNIPASFEQGSGKNRHLVRVEIREDGSIYIIPPKRKDAPNLGGIQPEGYPLHPK
ncbi:MAG TPA: hypothetical protein VMZ27_12460 [Candidatus Saccharimonadales bacterium]|nr:hypothetical protein [Candidatus Saccharimonadales bacterium]